MTGGTEDDGEGRLQADELVMLPRSIFRVQARGTGLSVQVAGFVIAGVVYEHGLW
jgi:hypothetical protein